MSAFKRVASGSLAMWSRMGLSILSQVLMVPIFLTYWSTKQYGAWLALQSVYSLITILDTAYQTYLENEFLKIGKTAVDRYKVLLYSSLPSVIFIGCLQALVFYITSQTTQFSDLMGLSKPEDHALLEQCSSVIFIWLVVMIFTTSTSGVIGRALSAIGYFSRFAWWGVLYMACSSLLPIAVLMNGGSLMTVGVAQAVMMLAYHVLWFWDAIKIMRKESITPVKPQWHVIISSLKSTIFVFLRLLLELSRQHGFRLLLAPMVGLKKLAEFATQRTIAGVATQSMNNIYGPLMPELMRYLRERDQDKTDTIFSLIWSLTSFLLCPLVYLLQVVMPLIYPIWTRGQFEFDGLLFMTISATLLVYAISLPAIAVCSGNNLVKLQMYISVIAFVVLFASLPVTIPLFGLKGAALSLILAEVTSSICSVWNALQWLRSAGLTWPTPMFRLAGFSLAKTLICCTLIAVWPAITVIVSVLFVALLAISAIRFWLTLPEQSRHYIQQHAKQMSRRFTYKNKAAD